MRSNGSGSGSSDGGLGSEGPDPPSKRGLCTEATAGGDAASAAGGASPVPPPPPEPSFTTGTNTSGAAGGLTSSEEGPAPKRLCTQETRQGDAAGAPPASSNKLYRGGGSSRGGGVSMPPECCWDRILSFMSDEELLGGTDGSGSLLALLCKACAMAVDHRCMKLYHEFVKRHPEAFDNNEAFQQTLAPKAFQKTLGHQWKLWEKRQLARRRNHLPQPPDLSSYLVMPWRQELRALYRTLQQHMVLLRRVTFSTESEVTQGCKIKLSPCHGKFAVRDWSDVDGNADDLDRDNLDDDDELRSTVRVFDTNTLHCWKIDDAVEDLVWAIPDDDSILTRTADNNLSYARWNKTKTTTTNGNDDDDEHCWTSNIGPLIQVTEGMASVYFGNAPQAVNGRLIFLQDAPRRVCSLDLQSWNISTLFRAPIGLHPGLFEVFDGKWLLYWHERRNNLRVLNLQTRKKVATLNLDQFEKVWIPWLKSPSDPLVFFVEHDSDDDPGACAVTMFRLDAQNGSISRVVVEEEEEGSSPPSCLFDDGLVVYCRPDEANL